MLAVTGFVLNFEQARQAARHFDNRDARLAATAFALEFGNEMQALVGHCGERMRGVKPDGCEHRCDLAREGGLHPAPLRGRQVRSAHQMNSGFA